MKMSFKLPLPFDLSKLSFKMWKNRSDANDSNLLLSIKRSKGLFKNKGEETEFIRTPVLCLQNAPQREKTAISKLAR